MSNNEEDFTDEAMLPISKADTAMEVIDRMKREEAAFATAMRLPTTTPDLSRAPGVPLPASHPTPLQPVTIPLPTVTPSTTFEPMEEARRYGVPVDAIIRADAARRQFDAYQRLAAEGFTPESVSKYGMFAFPSTSTRGMQPQLRAVPRGSDLVAYSPFGGAQTVRPAQGPEAAQVTYKELSDGSLDIQTTQPTGHVTHNIVKKGQSVEEKAAWLDLQQAFKEADETKIRDILAYIKSLQQQRPSIPTRVGAPATSTGTAAPAAKRPTRSVAADYVQRFGRDKAIAQLKSEGYDVSGYAD